MTSRHGYVVLWPRGGRSCMFSAHCLRQKQWNGIFCRISYEPRGIHGKHRPAGSSGHYQKYCYNIHHIRSSLSSTVAEPYINSGLRHQSLLISIQFINSGSSFELLLIIPSSVSILNQNRFGPDSKTINNDCS
jgi:hypothetical protein